MSILKKNYDAYKTTEISTADQKKLILMLYDGAIRFLQIAADSMEPHKYDIVNTNIIKAQDIITELMLSLDLERGGKIASSLFNIYAYLKKHLLEANLAKDAAFVHESSAMLQQLRRAWEQAVPDKSAYESRSTTRQEDLVEEGLSLSIRG